MKITPPPQPAVDTNSAEATNEATKLEGDLDLDEGFSVGADDADTFNDIAEQNLGSNKSVQEQSITAEYWVTNARVTAQDNQSLEIQATDSRITSETGALVETLAPGTGTQADNNVIFWQARVLSGEDKQTNGGGVDSTSKGKEIQSIRYYNSEFSYQEKGSDQWTEFTITNGKVQEQLVFYYMIKANFEQNVSVAITDWPNTSDSQIPYDAPSPHQVNYEVWKLEDEEADLNTATQLGETVDTYYNSALTISAIKVSMNENEQYYIQSIKISDTGNGSYTEPTVTRSQAEFALALSTAGNSPILTNNAVITIKIYVTAYKYELAYEKNGGTISGSGYTVAGFYRPNSEINAPTSANITKTGYTFVGWYKDKECTEGNKWTDSTDSKMPSKDLTLYAHWTEDTTAKPTTTDVYVYFKMVDAAGKNISKTKINNEDLKNTVYNAEADGATWATLGKIALTGDITEATLTNAREAAQVQLKNAGNLWDKNKNIAQTVLANVQWYQLKQWDGATDYEPNGSRWHLDGKITGYTVTYNKGTTDSVDKMPVADEMYYLRGSEYTVSDATPTRDGYVFTGWKSNIENDTTIYNAKGKFKMPAKNVVLTAQWAEEANYTVKHHKWDADQKKYVEDTAAAKTKTEKVGKEVTATQKTYPDYILNTQESKQKGIVTADGKLVLDLYYDIDKIGSGNNKDKPDGTPDRYQVTVNYVSSNTNWGSVNRSKEVITINKESGKWQKTGTVTAPSCTATSAGGRCYFVNWTKKQEGSTASSTVISSANLPAQNIENAKGGDVYTFTANFDRSSGGSSRPSTPPTVDIPDNDVPTGLNGKDHYAYIIGYGNNDVRPQNNITRAEVATIFFRLLTDETRTANMTKSNSYNDVKDGDWFCCAVSTLSKMGIIKGYEDGSFKPNDPISRAEFAAIAARFDPDGDKTPASFFDVTSHWAKDEISIAANHGWIKGYEDGSFKPDQKITRAETMTLVNRVLNRLPETKDDLHKDMKTWVDNMDETAWYYLDVQEATNSHYFKNKTGTKFEQWTDLRDTRDWSELEK